MVDFGCLATIILLKSFHVKLTGSKALLQLDIADTPQISQQPILIFLS
jgi:hypothetical protein